MDSLAAWVALAAAGVLHGLAPAASCLFATGGARAGWLPLLATFAAAPAAIALWPWLVRAAQAAGWLPPSPLDDLCGPGAAGTALSVAAIGLHLAGMLAGTAIAARLALGVHGASAILPGCLRSRSCLPKRSMRPASMRLSWRRSPIT